MAKQKEQNVFKILLDGTKIYFKNFVPMTRGMIFPVFGQLIGILLVFTASYFYTVNYVNIIPVMFNNILIALLGLILLTLPGFFIFTKAFWDYMLIMVSLNNLSQNIIENGKLRDLSVHTQSVALRTKDYIVLLLILTLVWLVALTVPFFAFLFNNIDPMLGTFSFVAIESVFLFIATLVSIYLSLSFQVFAFEDVSPIKVLKRSWNLIEGNFWRTIALCLSLYFITGTVFTQIGKLLFDNEYFINVFVSPVQAYLVLLFNNQQVYQKLTEFLTQYNLLAENQSVIDFLSTKVILATTDLVIVAIALPLGSVCYTLLYRDIILRQEKNTKNTKKKKSK